MKLTAADVERIKALAGKASPGPWYAYNEADENEPADWHVLCEPLHPSYAEPVAMFRRVRNGEHDSEYIASLSPEVVAQLAEALTRYGEYPMFKDEPLYCAMSMLATVEALWAARKEVARLKAVVSKGEGR